jgi:hypothetical protein
MRTNSFKATEITNLETGRSAMNKTQSLFFQPKLSINQPNDIYEQEANAMADKVTYTSSSMSTFFSPSFVQRKCAECEEEEKTMQRRESSNDMITSLSLQAENYISSLSGSKALSKEERTFFESKMGYDFSNVRIHNDSSAHQSAKNINALAYTHENNIVFGQGQYQPNTDEGKKLLAHELTHVVQQNHKNFPSGSVQAQRPGTRTTPTDILNNSTYTTSAYRQAVQHWPDSSSIWDILTTRDAKTNFVRYILSFDQTNCVPYDATDINAGESCSATTSAVTRFTNACQGYASQMYARYTSSGRLSATAETNLQSQANIVVGTVPVKFQIPIRIATVPGHAFNAVLIDADASDANSWLFFEPQNDQVFFASDPLLRSSIYATTGIFSLGRLTDFTSSGTYVQSEDNTFLLNSGRFTNVAVTTAQRIDLNNLLRDIFMADDPSAYPFYTNRHSPPQTYEQLIATHSTVNVNTLALAFTSLSGRQFRRAPGSPTEIMTKGVYLDLLNHPSGLDRLIP